ncbi:MAG TPA: oligosaccharide flippase family protein, partial [bacterium]|nr:oligosaccharide flippase family protein [bacterium]
FNSTAPYKERLLEKLSRQTHLFQKAAIMAGARSLGMAFGALGSVWAARCLGPLNFGISGMVQSLALLTNLFVTVIYPLVLIRDYKNIPDEGERNRLIGVTNGFRLAVSTAFCALAAAMLALGLEPAAFRFAGWFFLPLLLLNALQPAWIFQAAEKQHFQSLLAVLQPALTALFYAAFLRPGMSAGTDLLGITLVSAVLTFIYWKAVFRLTPFKGAFFILNRWREAWALIYKSRWLFLSALAIYVYNNLDQPLLGWLHSLEEQGRYRTAVRVTDAAQSFLAILPSIFFPRFIEWRKKGEAFFWARQKKLALYGGALGVLAVALVLKAIPFLYPMVFGAAYAGAAVPCVILVSAKIMDALGQVFSLGLMTDHANDKAVLMATLGTASFSLGTNLLFIPRFGMVTAATVNLLSETLMLGICFWLTARRIRRIRGEAAAGAALASPPALP